MRNARRDELCCRATALCFAVGAVLMAIAAVRMGQPLCWLASGLQLVAWWCFATRANQIEAGRNAAVVR